MGDNRSYVKVDLSNLEKDLRGICYQTIHEELNNLNIKELVQKEVKNTILKNMDGKIKAHVYSYLEEAQIKVPDNSFTLNSWNRNEEKITLNTYIIQIIKDCIVNRVVLELDKLDIRIKRSDET